MADLNTIKCGCWRCLSEPKAPQPGTRVSLGLKVTPATKVKLIRVSMESGRTMSQEAERLIELGMMFDVMISLGRERLWETCISAAAMGLRAPMLRNSPIPDGEKI